jgi:hypothetical protein
MASFKVLFDKTVILPKTKFDEIPQYNELRDKILAKCKEKKKPLTVKDNFILTFKKEDKSNDYYFPPELQNAIHDKNSFEFLKEKLSLRDLNENIIYKFQIEVGQKRKQFHRKKYEDILNSELNEVWKPICDDIKREIGLKDLQKGQSKFSKMKDELIKKEKKINGRHEGIICQNCFKTNIVGKRFVCSECINYNLCQDCEKIFYKEQIHDRKHILIQVNSPLNGDENNLLKYDNIISNNNQEIKLDNPDPFKIEVEVLNTGENDLNKCYLLPVRFGEEYLTCSTAKIEESLERGTNCKISLLIEIPSSNRKYYEGYFRMFTPSGLPFGQVLNVKAYITDE